MEINGSSGENIAWALQNAPNGNLGWNSSGIDRRILNDLQEICVKIFGIDLEEIHGIEKMNEEIHWQSRLRINKCIICVNTWISL